MNALRLLALATACTLALHGQITGFSTAIFAGTDAIGDGGAASEALLSQPEGLAVDRQGNIFLADADNHRIRRIAPDGQITTYAGTGQPGVSGDGGPASKARFQQPYGIAIDPAGTLYVADLGNARVRKITPDGMVSTVAGGGVAPAGPEADGSPATIVRLGAPRNLALDGEGNVYFSDFSAHRVYRVSPSGLIFTVAGTGQAGSTGDGSSALHAQLSSPAGLAVDSSGSLFLLEAGSRRIRRVTRGVIYTVRIIPSGSPTGLAVDSTGNLYYGDRGGGQITKLQISSGTVAYLPLAGGEFAFDAAGQVYASYSRQIRCMSASGSVRLIAGSGLWSFAGDNGPALAARLSGPAALARDSAGNVYIADTRNHRIRKVTPNGIITTVAGNGDTARLNGPGGLAIHRNGQLYIADTGNHRIVRLEQNGNLTVVAGRAPGSADSPVPAEAITRPAAMIFDTDGSLLFAESGEGRIRKLSPSGVVSAFALIEAGGMAFSPAAELWITDSTRGQVLRRSSNGGLQRVTDLPLNRPSGISFLSDGSALVSEEARILQIDPGGRTYAVTQPGDFVLPAAILALPGGGFLAADSGADLIRQLMPGTGAAISVAPPITVKHAASSSIADLAPGQIVSVYGLALGPAGGVSGSGESELAGTRLLVHGVPAALLFVSAQQINAVLPASLPAGTPLEIEVFRGSTLVGAGRITLAGAAPGLFTGSGSQAACINPDRSLNSPGSPASGGSIVSCYLTGAVNVNQVRVSIGGFYAEVLYGGNAPGFPGLQQVNVRIPAGAGTGQIPIFVIDGSAATQAGPVISVQ